MNAIRASLASLSLLFAAAPFAATKEYKPAPDEYKQEFVRKHLPACIESLESQPEQRALYSHETVVKLCTCRKQFLADAVYDAIENDRRDVHKEATDYSVDHCPVNNDGSVGIVKPH